MAANSTISGVINGGSGSTFQSGDTINGNATSNATVIIAAANANTLATINTLQSIRFTTLAADAINAQLFSNVGTVGITGSNAVLTVNNGALASTYSVASTIAGIADGLTVNIRASDVAGTADTINFAVSGAGSTGFGSALNSGSTLVERIAVATTGNNFFTVTGNTTLATDSAVLTLTGAGVNDVTIGGLATTSLINASAATGNLTLTLGANLTSNDTVQGGTGTGDTLRATTAGTIATGLSISGFETIRLDSGANSTLAFAAAPAATTLRIDTGVAGGTKTLSNFGNFTTLQYRGTGTAAAAGNQYFFNAVTATGGFTGTTDALAVAFSNSGVTATNATPYVSGVVNATGVETFNVSVADATANTTNVLLAGLTSSTLQSAVFTGASSFGVTGNRVVISTGAASNSIAAINFSGVTSTVASFVNVGIDAGANASTLSASTQITAGVGGLTVGIGTVEQASDVIIFTGAAGADTLDLATVGTGNFAGSVVANLGAGTNTLLTGTGAALVSITANDAATTGNTITVATTGAVSYVATGALTTSTINGGNVTANVTATGSTRAIAFVMGNVADTVVGGSANDTITGGVGADRLTGGLGNDRFVISTTAYSIAPSAAIGNLTSNAVQLGATFAFANGVDIITDFATGDTLAVIAGAAAASTTLIGITNATDQILAATNYSVRGNYAGTTFTVAADGADMLFVQAAGSDGTANRDIDTATNYQLLLGFGATAAGNTIAGTFLAA